MSLAGVVYRFFKRKLPVQDDDSDMECELEASPAVSHEASVEAIAHVKVRTES